jgi:DNA-binding NarL/FixJ family response regulator
MSDIPHLRLSEERIGVAVPRILIADDNEWIRKSLANALAAHNWTLCGEAANGREAIAMARELAPDLIVLDIAMPELDGLHAAAEISKSLPSVPIVAYTFHKSDRLELEGKKAGIRKVVSKGDPPALLFDTIQEFLAQSPDLLVAAEAQVAGATAAEAQATAVLEDGAEDAAEHAAKARSEN